MCNPMALAAVMMVAEGTRQYGQYKTGKAQAAALNKQNAARAEEIRDAASVELGERARAARRERARLMAAGSESGFQTSGGSFEALMMNSLFQQGFDQGLILENERTQQEAREAHAQSLMSQIQLPSFGSAALQIAGAGVQGYALGDGFSATDAPEAGTP